MRARCGSCRNCPNLKYGMIATGNHCIFDSLRGAPRSVSFLQRSNYSLSIRCGEAALPPPLGEVPTEFSYSVGGEGCFAAFALSVTPCGVPALPEGEPRVRNDKFQFACGSSHCHRALTGKPFFRSHITSRLPFSTAISASRPVKWLLTPRGKPAVRVPFFSS